MNLPDEPARSTCGGRIVFAPPCWIQPLAKYEIDIRYNTGDVIHAIFQNKADALKFLQSFE